MEFWDTYYRTFIMLLFLQTVKLQEFPPSSFLNLPNSIEIPEDIPEGSVIYTIEVAIFGEQGTVIHENYIISFDPPEAEGIFLVTNVFNGFEVSVRNNILLDFETPPTQYQIVVEDTTFIDGSGDLEPPGFRRKRQLDPGFIEALTINITDVNEPPQFGFDVFDVTVDESKVPVDTYIRIPEGATDEDIGDVISYSIVSIFPTIPTGILEINQTTGNIKLLSDYDVDQNVQPEVLLINIAATDTSQLSATAYVVVKINDINDNEPVFTEDGNYVMILPFEYVTIVNTEIGYVYADDRDAGENGTVRYFMARNNYFGLEAETGTIIIRTALPVDDTLSRMYSLTVIAVDSGTVIQQSSDTSSVLVYIVPYCTQEDDNCDLCSSLTETNSNQTNDIVTPADNIEQTESTVVLTENDEIRQRKTNVEFSTTQPPGRKKRVANELPINTCSRTTCSLCRDYISSTCMSVSLESCPSTEAIKTQAVNFDICWIIPLVIAVCIATVLIGFCLYKRLNKKSSRVAHKPPINTITVRNAPSDVTGVAPASYTLNGNALPKSTNV